MRKCAEFKTSSHSASLLEKNQPATFSFDSSRVMNVRTRQKLHFVLLSRLKFTVFYNQENLQFYKQTRCAPKDDVGRQRKARARSTRLFARAHSTLATPRRCDAHARAHSQTELDLSEAGFAHTQPTSDYSATCRQSKEHHGGSQVRCGVTE